jgi:uncharacterized protein YqeY
MLKTKIVEDLKTAMLAKNELATGTLRMLKAEIMKEEVSGTAKHELTDAEVVKIVKKLINQRRDSAEQFTKGDRPELAAKELAEIKLIEAYLPAQLDEATLIKLIADKKATLGITDKSKLGQLIGAVIKEVGDSADGGTVKKLVEASFS